MASGRADPFRELRAEVDAELARHFGAREGAGGEVGLAMRESVLAPAKRLRPLLTVLAARDLGCHSVAVLRAGCAVELVHTASLLLDDLPCMDDAATRRGRPAIHVRFGEDVAILAAIALLSDAYAMAATLPDVPGDKTARLVSALSGAIGLNGLVSGQYRDLHAPSALGPDEASAVNDQKTGSLFITCLEMAGTLAGSDASAARGLRNFGQEIGRAFQLYDDLLDVAGNGTAMGKDTGRDAGRHKLAGRIGREAMMDLIRSHVTAARAALAGLPVRPRGLAALTDHLFGVEDPPRRVQRDSSEPLMASLLARPLPQV